MQPMFNRWLLHSVLPHRFTQNIPGPLDFGDTVRYLEVVKVLFIDVAPGAWIISSVSIN